MIIFFGPAGAGKSLQGQILASRHGWRWLSAGQLLRDTHNTELIAHMQTGELVSEEVIQDVMKRALIEAKDVDKVILDGYPRELGQAKWLIETEPEHQHSIGMVVVLEVPLHEVQRRLKLRGRADDQPEVIERRLQVYRQEIYPILDYFNTEGVSIVHIDGTGTVGEVHDRVEAELASHGIIEQIS